MLMHALTSTPSLSLSLHLSLCRSSFGYNTNVWLSRRFLRLPSDDMGTGGSGPKGLMRLHGQASLFADNQDMKVWTSYVHPTQSIGFMDCSGLGAGHKAIFRCPCTPTAENPQQECVEQRKAVQDLLDQGKMLMQDW